MSDSYLFAASWLYFAVLSVAVAATSLAAFGRDLVPFGARTSPNENDDEISSSAKPPAL